MASGTKLPEQSDVLQFVPVVRGRLLVLQIAGVTAWIAAFGFFWIWWFAPKHYTAPIPFLLVTLTLAWITLAPAYFLLVFRGSRRPATTATPATGLKVAMVVTKAPSEPLEIVAQTLSAMLAQSYPHDTWLADEKPDAETYRWTAEHGVRISTRFGHPDYHRAEWPRRTRCKEGNLAFFYDHYGYANYDVVVQMDADHVPEPGYLEAMLVPFIDRRVGYVSAPSICDSNAGSSWSARGRLFAEASMHGSLQAGYNGGWAPLCIGSHYAVRTKALRQIGGLGPELAEDHSTTLMMNAAGWRGVHALDAIAHGFGPATFSDLIVQEFQWSRSLITILLRHTPALVRSLPTRLKFQFLFSELWYLLFSCFMALGVVMPIAALAFDINYADVSYIGFLGHLAPLSIVLIALAVGWRASGSFRPRNARIFSWEAMLFVIVRWPWSLLGCLAAICDCLSKSHVEFRVTPKGNETVGGLPARIIAPYVLISLSSAAAVLLCRSPQVANGYYLFALCNAVLYATAICAIIVAHGLENHLRPLRSLRQAASGGVAVAMLAAAAFAAAPHTLQGLEAITWNSPYVRLTDARYSVAGAGLGPTGVRVLRFHFQWLPGGRQ